VSWIGMIAQLDRESTASATRAGDYWQQSRRPLTSLFFVLPLLVLYEGGVLWLGPDGVRNGADLWMQQLLGFFGFGGFLLLPVLTIAILLGWHHTSRQPWRVSRSVLFGMAAESAALAVFLLVVADLQARLLALTGTPVPCQMGAGVSATGYASHLVRYFGAGIYEELLFRLILVPLVMAAVGLLIAGRQVKVAVALVLTSLLFAAAHYVGPHGDNYQLYSFVFRFVAGGFFVVLFVYRGFGIAAGTHALYDILVSVSA
jgi:membrane protease YdiL (CAAX protease family)